jgi:hypothetical protein
VALEATLLRFVCAGAILPEHVLVEGRIEALGGRPGALLIIATHGPLGTLRTAPEPPASSKRQASSYRFCFNGLKLSSLPRPAEPWPTAETPVPSGKLHHGPTLVDAVPSGYIKISCTSQDRQEAKRRAQCEFTPVQHLML